MNIVHITEAFSPTSETFIYNWITGLDNHGLSNQIFTLKRMNQIERPYKNIFVVSPYKRWQPIRLFSRIKYRFGIINYQEFTYDIYFNNARKQFYHLFDEIRPDIVHAQFGSMGVMIESITQRLSIPLIVSFHGYDVNRLSQSAKWLGYYSKLAKSVSAVTSTSNFLCSKLEQIGFPKHKIHQIYMGVDVQKFTYRDPVQNFDRKHVNCLFVGRLTSVKSPLHLVSAFELASKALAPNINLTLTIVGDGMLRKELEARIKTSKLNNITLLGAISHSEIVNIFSKSHIYLHYGMTTATGEAEGQGVTFVEASASGLPIISTRHGGIPDVVIDGETGYLVNEGDVRGMAEKIILLAQSPDLWTRLGAAGRQHVEANFTLEHQIERTIELYKQIAK